MRTIPQICLWLFFYCIPAIGQKQTLNWYFGDKAGLSFAGGNPVPVLNGALSTDEGVASISSIDGDLLFYTNGVSVWNKNHLEMDNGFGLWGNISTTQSAIIVPHPGNDSLYYVITVDYHAGTKGASYSVVNMNLNNGLGKVVVKNVALAENTTEKLSAVHRCNNKDVWVVVRSWDANFFYSFLIDKNGIDDIPITISSPYRPGGNVLGKLGSMKISPDGKTIAAAHAWGVNYVELGKFNEINGQITAIERLSVAPPGYNGLETGPYGVEFSPNSRYLYVYATYGSRSYIYQYDISLPTIADIQSSQQQIAELNSASPGSLQLAIDSKIYVTNAYDSSLSVIHQPDNAGIACNFILGDLRLGRRSTSGLPNFISSYVRTDFGPGEVSVTGCGTNTLNFSFNRSAYVSSMRWDFGDPASGVSNTSALQSPSHVFSGNGFYTVTLISTRACATDTIITKIFVGNLALNLNDNYDGCIGDSVELSVPFYAGLKYNWSNGARTSTIKVWSAGPYKITVTAGCSFGDSTQVRFFDKPLFTLGDDKTICTGQQVLLDPGITNARYLWSTGDLAPQLSVNAIGKYWVRITNSGNSCSASDTINVIDMPFPELSLGRDTTICVTEELVLRAGPGGANSDIELSWQDGSTSPTFRVTGPGLYWVRASNNCTVKTDSIRVDYKVCPLGIPNAFTPNGDGRNDRFRVKYGSGITEYQLSVFNRFGQLIFQTNNQLVGWDGTMSGKAQPAGTYVWQALYTDSSTGKPVYLKGTVTLIR